MMLPLFDMSAREEWISRESVAAIGDKYALMQDNILYQDMQHRWSAFAIQWICIAWCMLVGTEGL